MAEGQASNEYRLNIELVDIDLASSDTTKKRKREDGKVVCSCDQCEYTGSSAALSYHKQSKHEGIRFQCDQCAYIATRQSSLIRHKKSVHEGFLYPCNKCNYAATYLANLKQHKASVHDGVKYPCDQCAYTATQMSSLKLHKESVHEKMNYTCDLCEYTAKKYSTLRYHKKVKHNLNNKKTVKGKGKNTKQVKSAIKPNPKVDRTVFKSLNNEIFY